MRLFSTISQKTSKSGKNIIDTLGYRLVCNCFLMLRTATWNLFVSFNKDKLYKIVFLFIRKRVEQILSPFWQTAIWRNLFSIQNEANSLVALQVIALWLVQRNHVAVKLVWNERCRHLCACSLIDHSWEPIKTRAGLSLSYKYMYTDIETN